MRTWLVAFLIILSSISQGYCETWYVSNKIGSDTNYGNSPENPLATISQAIKKCKTSDTFSLANTGKPYRENLHLVRLGGTPARPFIIEGNGAVLSGLRTIKPEQWTKNGDVYEIQAVRPYGFPSLLVDGKIAPIAIAGKLKPGQWDWLNDPANKQRGTLRFRPASGTTPADYQIEATLEVSGLQVASSSYVVVKNLISEWHSNDGFNIHGDCRGIAFENIEGRFNGDDGFSIHEAIEAVVRNGHFHHNGSGIEDVNLSRSFYSGIRVHDNRKIGVLFIGAFHSAVDAVVANNPQNFLFTPGETKHLLGGPESPIRETSIYLQNVLIWGGTYGIKAGSSSRVMVTNSIIANTKVGIEISGKSSVHLTKSIVANSSEAEIRFNGEKYFGDYNIYYPGHFVAGDKQYSPEQWNEFRELVGHNKNSFIQDPKLIGKGNLLTKQSPRQIGKHKIGPTASYFTLE